MNLPLGQCVIRLRDGKEFVVLEAHGYRDEKSGICKIYRFTATCGDRESEFSNDVELDTGMARFKIVGATPSE